MEIRLGEYVPALTSYHPSGRTKDVHAGGWPRRGVTTQKAKYLGMPRMHAEGTLDFLRLTRNHYPTVGPMKHTGGLDLHRLARGIDFLWCVRYTYSLSQVVLEAMADVVMEEAPGMAEQPGPEAESGPAAASGTVPEGTVPTAVMQETTTASMLVPAGTPGTASMTAVPKLSPVVPVPQGTFTATTALGGGLLKAPGAGLGTASMAQGVSSSGESEASRSPSPSVKPKRKMTQHKKAKKTGARKDGKAKKTKKRKSSTESSQEDSSEHFSNKKGRSSVHGQGLMRHMMYPQMFQQPLMMMAPQMQAAPVLNAEQFADMQKWMSAHLSANIPDVAALRAFLEGIIQERQQARLCSDQLQKCMKDLTSSKQITVRLSKALMSILTWSQIITQGVNTWLTVMDKVPSIAAWMHTENAEMQQASLFKSLAGLTPDLDKLLATASGESQKASAGASGTGQASAAAAPTKQQAAAGEASKPEEEVHPGKAETTGESLTKKEKGFHVVDLQEGTGWPESLLKYYHQVSGAPKGFLKWAGDVDINVADHFTRAHLDKILAASTMRAPSPQLLGKVCNAIRRGDLPFWTKPDGTKWLAVHSVRAMVAEELGGKVGIIDVLSCACDKKGEGTSLMFWGIETTTSLIMMVREWQAPAQAAVKKEGKCGSKKSQWE